MASKHANCPYFSHLSQHNGYVTEAPGGRYAIHCNPPGGKPVVRRYYGAWERRQWYEGQCCCSGGICRLHWEREATKHAQEVK